MRGFYSDECIHCGTIAVEGHNGMAKNQEACPARNPKKAVAFQVGNRVATSCGWRGRIVGVRVVDGEVVFDVEHDSGYPTNPFVMRELTHA